MQIPESEWRLTRHRFQDEPGACAEVGDIHLQASRRAPLHAQSAGGSPKLGPPRAGVVRFGRYTLDPASRQLLADGQPLAIGGRAFDLLHQLVRQAGRTVSTDELRRAVWPDRAVGENNLRVQITALRKLLGDGVIALHPARGYRFTWQVSEEGEAAELPSVDLGNLPIHMQPLHGRDAELAALAQDLVGQARLTVTGSAGMGKTALARAAAHRSRSQAADGVWWIDVGPLRESAQLAERIADLLQLAVQGPAPFEAIGRAMGDRQMLLVLDGCEHLAEAVCAFADALLRHAPRVALLSTSQRELKCAGERTWRLGPLAVPDEPSGAGARRSGAVMLFEARARRSDPDFAVTADNVDAVVDLCRRLHGQPLAIGLMAAKVHVLGLGPLRDRLVDRLQMSAGAAPGQASEAQALRAALDCSVELLDAREQTVLLRLAPFSGSFALTSVQALVHADGLDDWAVIEAMNKLIGHSLVCSDPAALQSGASMRYTMHDSVRRYLLEQLDASGETEALLERHARHQLDLIMATKNVAATGAKPRSQTFDDADHDNLRAALDWAREHDIALALALAAGANTFLRRRGHHLEARRIGQLLLQDPRSVAHPDAVRGLKLAQAVICFEQNDLESTLKFAMAVIDDQQRQQLDHGLLGEAWACIGVAHQMRNEIDLAEAALHRALHHHQLAGRLADTASQLNNLGLVMVAQRRFDAASEIFKEALALNRRLQRHWGVAVTLENLGEAAYAQGDAQAAQLHWQSALPTMRQLGHLYHEAMLLIYVGMALRRNGAHDAALAHAREGLRIGFGRQLGGLIADGLGLMAVLAHDRKELPRAAMLFCLSDRHRGKASPIGPAALDRLQTEPELRKALGETGWQAARLDAQRQPLDRCPD